MQASPLSICSEPQRCCHSTSLAFLIWPSFLLLATDEVVECDGLIPAGVAEDIPQSVWAEYQTLWRQANPGRVPCFPDPENAEPCNPGLDITRRIIFFVIILSGLVLATGWQALVVDNYGKRLKAYFPVKDRVLLTL